MWSILSAFVPLALILFGMFVLVAVISLNRARDVTQTAGKARKSMAKKKKPVPKSPSARRKRAASEKKGQRFEMVLGKQEKTQFQVAARRQGIFLAQWLRLAAWKVINEHGGSVVLIEIE